MPTYEITAPDGKVLEINAPDGATQEQVMAYAQQNYKPQASKPQPVREQVDSAAIARQVYDDSPWYQRPFIAAGGELTRIGRGVAQLVTPDDSEYGKALQARIDADAPMQEGIHGVSGFIGRALPYLATLPIGGPEAAALGRIPQAGRAAQLAVKAGTAAAEGAGYGALGETRTGESRLENAGYGALGGLAGRGIVGGARGAARGLAREADPILQADIEAARRAGIPLHVAQVGNSRVARVAAGLADYLPFSGAAGAARNQQNAWNRALTRATGKEVDRLDDQFIPDRKSELGNAYNQIWSRNEVAITPQIASKMQRVVADAYRDLGTEGGRVVENQFNRILDDVVMAGKNGTISGRNYQTLSSDLAKVQPGSPVGEKVGRIRGALIEAADASVSPKDAQLLSQTNRQWNNMKTLEELLKRPAGAKADISPAALWAAVNKRGPKATPEYRELAKVGQNLLKDPIPNSGTVPRLVPLMAASGGGLLDGGASLATLLAAGPTLGRALNSPTVGGLFARGAGEANGLARMLAAQGAKGATRKGVAKATQRSIASHKYNEAPPLELDIVGGTPGAAISEEELRRLRGY